MAARGKGQAPKVEPVPGEIALDLCAQLADEIADLLPALDHHMFSIDEITGSFPKAEAEEGNMHMAARDLIYQAVKKKSRDLAKALDILNCKVRAANKEAA